MPLRSGDDARVRACARHLEFRRSPLADRRRGGSGDRASGDRTPPGPASPAMLPIPRAVSGISRQARARIDLLRQPRCPPAPAFVRRTRRIARARGRAGCSGGFCQAGFGQRGLDGRNDDGFRREEDPDHRRDGLVPAVQARDETAEAVFAEVLVPVRVSFAQALELEHEFELARSVVPTVDDVGTALLRGARRFAGRFCR